MMLIIWEIRFEIFDHRVFLSEKEKKIEKKK